MKLRNIALLLCVVLLAAACSSVTVTKTAKGFFEPTDPNNIDILHEFPQRSYIEIGSLSAAGHKPQDTAKMHNALRAKSAALGAHAVVILSQAIDDDGKLWVTGVCLRYDD